MRPATFTGMVVDQRSTIPMRGLLKLVWPWLRANPLLRSAATRGLGGARAGIAKGGNPTAGVERMHAAGEARTQVLVIDRDRELVELVGYVLGRAGIDFLAVHDTASALEAVAFRRPLVVILDPYGLDALSQLRTSGDDTAIIVLSAGDVDDSRMARSGLGADYYLTKPFSCNELVTSVRACLRGGHVIAQTRVLQDQA
jgi:CheY-like chemotaxis protein